MNFVDRVGSKRVREGIQIMNDVHARKRRAVHTDRSRDFVLPATYIHYRARGRCVAMCVMALPLKLIGVDLCFSSHHISVLRLGGGVADVCDINSLAELTELTRLKDSRSHHCRWR